MKVEQEIVLVFRMEEEKRKKIRMICFQMGMSVVEVSEDQENAPLGLLAKASGWRNPLLSANGRETEPLTEEMLLFAGFSDQSLDMFLAKLRQYQAVVSLKAVLTEQNAVWNAGQLQGELKQERAAFLRRN